MKIRTDFVTNSSSTSYCICTIESEELAEYLRACGVSDFLGSVTYSNYGISLEISDDTVIYKNNPNGYEGCAYEYCEECFGSRYEEDEDGNLIEDEDGNFIETEEWQDCYGEGDSNSPEAAYNRLKFFNQKDKENTIYNYYQEGTLEQAKQWTVDMEHLKEILEKPETIIEYHYEWAQTD